MLSEEGKEPEIITKQRTFLLVLVVNQVSHTLVRLATLQTILAQRIFSQLTEDSVFHFLLSFVGQTDGKDLFSMNIARGRTETSGNHL